MDEHVVEVRALTKTFHVRGPGGARAGHHVEAVRDVSFQLRRASALGIVGESGSGKTTIARLLLGLERPSAGTIHVEGTDYSGTGNSVARRMRAQAIQMVFQNPYGSLDPHQRIAAGIDEIQRVHFNRTVPERTARTVELLEAVGLGERHARAVPRDLSGGQRQRVAIARALAPEPRLLVLDEALSALDVSIQAQILNLLSELRSRLGLAYILISHDLAVVRQVVDECIVMYRGTVVERGPIDSILAQPRHPYTRRLISSVPRAGMALPVGRAGSGRPGHAGCRYAWQCELVHAHCVEEPDLVELGSGHAARCWLAIEDPDETPVDVA